MKPGGGAARRPWTIVLAVLLCVASTRHAGAEVRIGATGGLARYNFSGDTPDKGKYTSLTGGTFGAAVELELHPGFRLSMQPSWIQKGTGIAFELRGQKERIDSVEVDTDYFSLPIMMRVFTNGGKWFVSSGVEFAWLHEARYVTSDQDSDITDDLDDLDIAIQFGVGRIVPVGRHEFFIEGRYTQSLLNVVSVEEPADRAYRMRVKNSGLLLLVGFMFRL